MQIIEYIKKNPNKTKQYLLDLLTYIFIIATVLMVDYGELLPATISGILAFIVTVGKTIIVFKRIVLRDNIIKTETGKTVNEILGIDEVNTDNINDFIME